LNPPFYLLAEETAEIAASGVAERIARLPLAWAVVLAAISVFLLLPRGGQRGRRVGILLGLISTGLFGWYGLTLGGWVEDLVFYVLAGVTIVAATATITSRSPVYSAVWFALVLLGVAGLFLYQGAQFLSVATVVVYAGAILVTFLFVLMLAQPGGDAYYDRISWEPLLSAVAGAVLVGLLTGALLQASGTALIAGTSPEESSPTAGSGMVIIEPLELPIPPGADQIALRAPRGVLTDDHVATLGQEMFSRHLIAVQVAGALLLAALVGAVAIVTQGKQLPQVDPHAREHGSSAHV
jgi:NADH-quinone oxidoreductase subunit J